MSDTPTTGVAQATPDGELRRQILSQCVAKNEREWWAAGTIEKLEFELNAANDRIKSLIEERDRANRLAEWKWNLRDEFQLLLGTDKIEEGIEVVKELKRRIKRLEDGDAALTYSIGLDLQKENEALKARIQRLEEAGDYIVEENDIHIGKEVWRKAKEAKP